METIIEQTSFLDNNDAINAAQIDRTKKTFTTNNTGRQYTKPYVKRQPVEFPYSRRPQDKLEASFVRRPIQNNATEQSESPFIRRSLPNKAFDQEYMTEWGREVKFLADKGIPYTYVKRTPDYGISQFKYKKTAALFSALNEFYSQVETERLNLASADEVQEVLKGAGISIRRGRNGNITFVKDDKLAESEDVTE